MLRLITLLQPIFFDNQGFIKLRAHLEQTNSPVAEKQEGGVIVRQKIDKSLAEQKEIVIAQLSQIITLTNKMQAHINSSLQKKLSNTYRPTQIERMNLQQLNSSLYEFADLLSQRNAARLVTFTSPKVMAKAASMRIYQTIVGIDNIFKDLIPSFDFTEAQALAQDLIALFRSLASIAGYEIDDTSQEISDTVDNVASRLLTLRGGSNNICISQDISHYFCGGNESIEDYLTEEFSPNLSNVEIDSSMLASLGIDENTTNIDRAVRHKTMKGGATDVENIPRSLRLYGTSDFRYKNANITSLKEQLSNMNQILNKLNQVKEKLTITEATTTTITKTVKERMVARIKEIITQTVAKYTASPAHQPITADQLRTSLESTLLIVPDLCDSFERIIKAFFTSPKDVSNNFDMLGIMAKTIVPVATDTFFQAFGRLSHSTHVDMGSATAVNRTLPENYYEDTRQSQIRRGVTARRFFGLNTQHQLFPAINNQIQLTHDALLAIFIPGGQNPISSAQIDRVLEDIKILNENNSFIANSVMRLNQSLHQTNVEVGDLQIVTDRSHQILEQSCY